MSRRQEGPVLLLLYSTSYIHIILRTYEDQLRTTTTLRSSSFPEISRISLLYTSKYVVLRIYTALPHTSVGLARHQASWFFQLGFSTMLRGPCVNSSTLLSDRHYMAVIWRIFPGVVVPCLAACLFWKHTLFLLYDMYPCVACLSPTHHR